MPMMWIEPEEVVRHNRRRVYHAYKDGSVSRPYRFHYTTDDCEDDDYCFDIRDLSIYNERMEHVEILKQAIDQNLLRFPPASEFVSNAEDKAPLEEAMLRVLVANATVLANAVDSGQGVEEATTKLREMLEYYSSDD